MSFISLTLQIAAEWASGLFVIKAGDEDIHTANERRLKVGIILPGCHLLLTHPKEEHFIQIPFLLPNILGTSITL